MCSTCSVRHAARQAIRRQADRFHRPQSDAGNPGPENRKGWREIQVSDHAHLAIEPRKAKRRRIDRIFRTTGALSGFARVYRIKPILFFHSESPGSVPRSLLLTPPAAGFSRTASEPFPDSRMRPDALPQFRPGRTEWRPAVGHRGHDGQRPVCDETGGLFRARLLRRGPRARIVDWLRRRIRRRVRVVAATPSPSSGPVTQRVAVLICSLLHTGP